MSKCIYNPKKPDDATYMELAGINKEEITKLDALLHDLKHGHYDNFNSELRPAFVSLIANVRLRALKEAKS